MCAKVLSTFGSGFFMGRIRGNYIITFGLGCATIANLLFAVPIPPSTSYFAFGFPAMALAALGVDTVYPCLGLYTTQSLPRKDQGVAGAMFQTMGGLGRAMFLPITSTIQADVQTRLIRKEQRNLQRSWKGCELLSGSASPAWAFPFYLPFLACGTWAKLGC